MKPLVATLFFVMVCLVSATSGQCVGVCQGLLAEMQRRDSLLGIQKTNLLKAQHAPIMVIRGTDGTVSVGDGGKEGNSTRELVHPMTWGNDGFQNHFIEAVLVVDQDGTVVASAMLTPGTYSQSAVLSFKVPSTAKTLQPFVYCNQHGLYQADPVTISTPGSSPISCAPTCPTMLTPEVLYYEYQKENAMRLITTAVTDEAGYNKHTPVIAVNGVEFTVTVGTNGAVHPNDATADIAKIHYIDSLLVVDMDTMQVVAFGWYLPSNDSPVLKFRIGSAVKNITAFAHCNKHGMYSSTPLAITPAMRDPTFKTITDYIKCDAVCTTYPSSPLQYLPAAYTMPAVNQMRVSFGTTRTVKQVVLIYNATHETSVYIGGNGTDPEANVKCASGVTNGTKTCIASAEYVWVVESSPTKSVSDITVAAKGEILYTDAVPTCVPATVASEAVRQQYNTYGSLMQPTNAKHKPMLTIKNYQGIVSIGEGTITGDAATVHPMVLGHYIDTVWVVDQDEKVIASGVLIPNQGVPATLSFTIPRNTKTVTAYSHCNIHGLFKGDTMVLTAPTANTNPPVCGYAMCGGVIGGGSPLCLDEDVNGCSGVYKEMDRRTATNEAKLTGIHLPVLQIMGNGVGVVSVSAHPSTVSTLVSVDPYAVHFIDYIGVMDEDDNIIAAGILPPSAAPTFQFTIPNGTQSLIPFAHCNRHGLYKNTAVSIASKDTAASTYSTCGDSFRPDVCLGVDTMTPEVCSSIANDIMVRNAVQVPNEKHTPFVTLDTTTMKGKVVIGAPGNYHPQVASSDPNTVHFIEIVWVTAVDVKGMETPFIMWAPSPSADTTNGLSFEFDIPTWALQLTAYSKCNLHGLFSFNITNTAVVQGQQPPSPSPCAVGECFQDKPPQVACDSYKAETIRVGRAQTSVDYKVYVRPRDGGLANVVVLGKTNASAPHVNTFLEYVRYLVAVDQDGSVLAVGLTGPTEVYSSLEFAVQDGVTKMKGMALMSNGVMIDGDWVEVTAANAGVAKECVVSKCLLQKCSMSTDYGGGGDGDIGADPSEPDAADGDDGDNSDGGNEINPTTAPTPAPPTPSPSSGSDSTSRVVLIVVIVVAILATVGGVGYFFARSSRQKDAAKFNFEQQCELINEDPTTGEMHHRHDALAE